MASAIRWMKCENSAVPTNSATHAAGWSVSGAGSVVASPAVPLPRAQPSSAASRSSAGGSPFSMASANSGRPRSRSAASQATSS